MPPEIHCTPCDLLWPEHDPETTRRCPNCRGWLDHVPMSFRDSKDDETPQFLGAGTEIPARYLLIIEGKGFEAAGILEDAGIIVSRMTEMPGHHHAPRGVDYKHIALWLADCHAATAEHLCRLAKTSKASATRLRRICATAADAIEGKAVALSRAPQGRGADVKAITARLRRAAEEKH